MDLRIGIWHYIKDLFKVKKCAGRHNRSVAIASEIICRPVRDGTIKLPNHHSTNILSLTGQ
jgi:hypothetical protein